MRPCRANVVDVSPLSLLKEWAMVPSSLQDIKNAFSISLSVYFTNSRFIPSKENACIPTEQSFETHLTIALMSRKRPQKGK